MRIAYCSASIIPSRSANSIHVMNMCSSFSTSNEVTLYHRKGHGRTNNIYKYYNVKKSFVMKSTYWPNIPLGGILYGLLNAFYTKKDDIIYCRDFYTAIFSSVIFRKKVVYEAHALPNGFMKRYLERFMIKRNSLIMVVVISNALKIDYENVVKIKRKIFVAHDGASLLIKDPKFSDHNIVKNVGYIGHLYRGRGIETIIELAKRFTKLNFHIVGGTESDIDRYKSSNRLNNLIIHGFIKQESLKDIILSFDILLAPYQNKVAVHGGKGDTSRWMSPLKIFEYMSACKPIICSDFPVLREVLENGVNAILCKADDIDEWASAVNNLIKDKNLRISISNNAHYEFIKKYTWESRANRIENEIIFRVNGNA